MDNAIKVGTVIKCNDTGYEGVVIHNRKLPGDICILWNIDNDLYKSLFSFDEKFIITKINNKEWEIIK